MSSFSISIDNLNTAFCTNGKITYISVRTPFSSGSANRSDGTFYTLLYSFIDYIDMDKLRLLTEECPEDEILMDILSKKIISLKASLETLEQIVNN